MSEENKNDEQKNSNSFSKKVIAIIIIFVVAVIGNIIFYGEDYFNTDTNTVNNETITNNTDVEENSDEDIAENSYGDTQDTDSVQYKPIFDKNKLYGEDIPDCVVCSQEGIKLLRIHCKEFKTEKGKSNCRRAIASRYCKADNEYTRKFATFNDEEKKIFLEKYYNDTDNYRDRYLHGCPSNSADKEFGITCSSKGCWKNHYWSYGAYLDRDYEVNDPSYSNNNRCVYEPERLNKFNCYEQRKKEALNGHNLSQILEKIKKEDEHDYIYDSM